MIEQLTECKSDDAVSAIISAALSTAKRWEISDLVSKIKGPVHLKLPDEDNLSFAVKECARQGKKILGINKLTTDNCTDAAQCAYSNDVITSWLETCDESIAAVLLGSWCPTPNALLFNRLVQDPKSEIWRKCNNSLPRLSEKTYAQILEKKIVGEEQDIAEIAFALNSNELLSLVAKSDAWPANGSDLQSWQTVENRKEILAR